VAVIGQGTFGCLAAKHLGDLASSIDLRFGSGDLRYHLQFPELQGSGDAIFNRKGFEESGYRFGRLEILQEWVLAGQIGTVICLHDSMFSTSHENELLVGILQLAPFSLALEPIPSKLSEVANARLPVATYLEEDDFIINHDGKLRRYSKAIEPPKGVKSLPAWLKELKMPDPVNSL